MTEEIILKMAEKNNGTVTSKMIDHHGIARQYLKQLVDKGLLERTSRGIYTLPHIWEDEMQHLQIRFKKGIYSKETALYLYDLTMTFPEEYNLTTVKKEGIIASRTKNELYELGQEEILSPSGNSVITYNAERTLCDILRPRSGVEIGITAEAFKRYIKRKDKNIPLLSEYSKIMKVEEKVSSYLEVLL